MFTSPTDSSFLRAATSQSSIRLKEAHDRLDSVVEHVGDGIITIDDGGLIETFNSAAEKLFGYSAAELMGRSVSLLVSAPREAGVEANLADEPRIRVAEIAGTGREVIGRRKDGSIFPIDLAVSCFSRAGRQYFTGIIRDISERKKLEFEQQDAHERLQEANERLRSVVDYVVDGIVTIDEQGTIASWNRSAERIFGYSSDEMIGENISRLMPEPHRSSHDGHLASYGETGIAKVVGINREMIAQRKDGSIFPIDLAVSEYVLEGKRLFTGIIRDITERKRADERTQFLVSATALLASVVDSSSLLSRVAKLPVPNFADWCIVDLCGSRSDVDAGCVRKWAVAHADTEQKTILRRLKKRLPNSFGTGSLVGSVLRRGKSRLIVDAVNPFEYAEPLTSEDRDLLCGLDVQSMICVPLATHRVIFGAITCVLSGTARKYCKEDLAAAEDFAQRASIAIENARLYDEAKEADRRKDEFLATLAHELRNPLAPVRNALEIARTEGVDHQVAERALTVIDRQVDHMVRLVDDLLDLSRLMRGKIQLRKERLLLKDVIARSIETARPLIDSHGHKLEVSVPKGPVALFADPVRIEQIISNLLDNAAKYTERGGLIKLRAKARGDEVVIKVRDTGIGIDPQLLPHLFDLFRQAESSLDRSRGGLGIGLTLVRRLVDIHGGRVEARSEGPGTGAEFIVRLPLHREQAPAPVPEVILTSSERDSGPQHRILVVDDNVDAAEMLSTLLRLDGHRVWVVHDGKAALDAAQAYRPDVILLDIGLPELNGYEVAKLLRTREKSRRIVIIAMTGYGQERDCQRSLDAGCDAHLTKPVAPQALRTFLRDLNGKAIEKI
ncbi:MAG TPA: PAS domain S-box protein [Planctomycetaceae bacterium]|jgi:PAS domain S-box-containing protein|nr:PAS domain S-box protein [Planctomycetaceae bacterium]